MVIHHDNTFEAHIAYLGHQQIYQLGDLFAADALVQTRESSLLICLTIVDRRSSEQETDFCRCVLARYIETYDPLREVLCLVLHAGDTAHIYRWKFQRAASMIGSWYQPPAA